MVKVYKIPKAEGKVKAELVFTRAHNNKMGERTHFFTQTGGNFCHFSAQGVWRQPALEDSKRDKAIPRQDSHLQPLGKQAGMLIISFLQLLGAHKGHKLQGSRSHLLLGEVQQDILAPPHPRLMLQCCPYVPSLSPGFPVTASTGTAVASSCSSGYSQHGNICMPALEGPSPAEELLGHLQ